MVITRGGGSASGGGGGGGTGGGGAAAAAAGVSFCLPFLLFEFLGILPRTNYVDCETRV